MTAYDKIQKDSEYIADNWIMMKTNNSILPAKPGACIRMYMSKGQRQAMYHLRTVWGCSTWEEFVKRLLNEYEVKVICNGASR